jgi:hypothetical protein
MAKTNWQVFFRYWLLPTMAFPWIWTDGFQGNLDNEAVLLDEFGSKILSTLAFRQVLDLNGFFRIGFYYAFNRILNH